MGLAQFLAERGLLPMYGMPTRVRQLYLGLAREGDSPQPDFFWSEMDRDLDMAIFEFAPGSVLVKDKQKHRAIGFTGRLMEAQLRGNDIDLGQLGDWFGDEAYVAWRPTCGAAKHREEQPRLRLQCDDCAGEMMPIHSAAPTHRAFQGDCEAIVRPRPAASSASRSPPRAASDAWPLARPCRRTWPSNC
jgi:hypothetical protein